MKNFSKIALLAIAALSFNAVSAQTTTNLNVNLSSLYSIEVTNPTVTIQMNNASYFTAGNTTGALSNHLKVSATGGYQVSVVAGTDLTSPGGDVISVGTVTVAATEGTYSGASGSTDPGTDAEFPSTAPALSTSVPAVVIESTSGDLRGFNVEYKIPAESAPAYLNKPAATYTTQLTYSIVAN